jgi:hypothetical protein
VKTSNSTGLFIIIIIIIIIIRYSISCILCLSFLLFLSPYSSWFRNWPLGRHVCVQINGIELNYRWAASTALLATCFTLASYVAYSMKMKVTGSSVTPTCFQRTSRHYIFRTTVMRTPSTIHLSSFNLYALPPLINVQILHGVKCKLKYSLLI